MLAISNPKQLLSLASSEIKRKYIPLSDYGETIHILYTKKNMTYSEIQEWLFSKGLDYSLGRVCSAYKEWKYNQAMKGIKIK